LKYLLPLGLLAIAAMWGIPKLMNMNSMEGTPVSKGEINAPAIPGMPDLPEMDFGSIPGLDALGETGSTLTSGLKDLTSGLQGVTDVEGAKGFAEKITGFTGSLDGMGLDKLDGVAKTATTTIFEKFMGTIKDMLAGKSEGIQGILKPVIETLMEKLTSFGG